MATSSSDESSTAPRDFHISSSVDSGSRLSLAREKCLMCGNYRKVFYCKDCIHNGLFFHSKHLMAESYLEKRKTLLELEDKKKTIEKKCLKYFEVRQNADILRSKIRQCRDRNRIIKLAVEEKKQKRQKYLMELERLHEQIRNTSDKMNKYKRKIDQMEDLAVSKEDEVEQVQEVVEVKNQEIMRLAKIRVNELKYIFPITEVEPKSEVECDNAISDSSQTEQWEYANISMESNETYYKIVESIMPASGNYSAYNTWVAQNKDAIFSFGSTNDLLDHNKAYRISAGLTYTAQLVDVLAFIFNVRLPFRMFCSDFCVNFMDEAQFNRRVARLNANILYLCFTQNIEMSGLKPCETLRNLLRLLDIRNPHMARQGPYEVDSTADVIYEPLDAELQFNGDNTDSDEGDSFNREWETVPRELPNPAPVMQSAQVIPTQQTTSMAGGLVTSAAANLVSIWRGITGR